MARLVESRLHTTSRDPSDRRRTVLIIEGPASPSTRLRLLAGRAGFRVITASSGRLLVAAAHRSSPDLIVLSPDTGPPGPSEVARSLKEEPRTRDIPIISIVEGGRFSEDASFAYPTEAVLKTDAEDEEIVKTMRMLTTRAPRLRYGRRPNAPLEGDLDSDTFPELLQFLFVTGKTGRLTVRKGRCQGMICLEAGRVVHAELGESEGISAFRQMCFSQQGCFRFEPGAKAPRRSMKEEGIGLLLDSARRKDIADRDRTRSRVASRPMKPPFEPNSGDAFSKRAVPASLGLVLLVGALAVVAFGVYAWAAG